MTPPDSAIVLYPKNPVAAEPRAAPVRRTAAPNGFPSCLLDTLVVYSLSSLFMISDYTIGSCYNNPACMKAKDIIETYVGFFEERNHARIPNSSLIPENDPTTLFTSSGMQPLLPYLLGEPHPSGKRLVNVQNSFRAVDIDEVGDNRHTTFFRMLGNWSLGDYFKQDEIPWLFEYLTKRLNIDPKRLYITVFDGYESIRRDTESENIWRGLLESVNLNPDERIFSYGVDKNWWSRSGSPDKMPTGEPGGPSTEAFYDFGADLKIHENSPYKDQPCHLNCDCGRYVEIGNSVFMAYMKQSDGTLKPLAKPNVDFGGGLERLVMATENKQDVFETSLLAPIIQTVEETTRYEYATHKREMRILTDHLVSSAFIIASGIRPTNKEQGYILRRLLRRSFDNLYKLNSKDVTPIVEQVIEQYKDTDEYLVDRFKQVKNVILEEEQSYIRTLAEAKKFIQKRYKHIGDELMGVTEISADDAFLLYTTHGLSPTQIESLGFSFDRQQFADKMEEHQKISRAGAKKKFAGGLADHSERTIKGHTATHLLHQALRDVLGSHVHQTGSNITAERVRFDFNFDRKLTGEETQKVEEIVNEKIKQNLPVHFEIMPAKSAKEIGAIGLFNEKYQDKVKVYFIGGSGGPSVPAKAGPSGQHVGYYSVEFCGGPHVDFTGRLKSFKIVKDEGLGRSQRRIYAVVE